MLSHALGAEARSDRCLWNPLLVLLTKKSLSYQKEQNIPKKFGNKKSEKTTKNYDMNKNS